MSNSINLPIDKKLLVKRTIRKIREKILRTTGSAITSESVYCNDFWDYVKNSTNDESSRLCLAELMNLRHAVKEDLKNFIAGERIIDEKNSLLSFLQDYDLQSTIASVTHRLPNNISHVDVNNPTTYIPSLDISNVRKDDSVTGRQCSENYSSILYKGNDLLHLSQSTESVGSDYSVKNSPREVTDSSVESEEIEEVIKQSLRDSTVYSNLRNTNVNSYANNELPSSEKYGNIVIEDKPQTSTVKWKKLEFIPSIPVVPQNSTFVKLKEAEVQTTESHLDQKEVRDVATDLPFLDVKLLSDGSYSMHKMKDELVTDESDFSLSVMSSDQSAGQISAKLLGSHPIVAVLADGSIHKRSPRVYEVTDESELSSDSPEPMYRYQRVKFSNHFIQHCNSIMTCESESNRSESVSRTPRVSETTWRPSSRRLQLEEVDISSSQDAVEMLHVREKSLELSPNSSSLQQSVPSNHTKNPSILGSSPMEEKCESFTDESNKSLTCNTTMSVSSHHDEEHTCNQISQIISD